MRIESQIVHRLYPAIRRARWRRWLMVAALVCTVGIYSIGLTHHHKTLAAELQCPICHVMAHGSSSALKPNLVPPISYAGWYRHILPRPEALTVTPRRDHKAQPRAPPVSAASFA